jgi:hypothetical protein
MDWLQTVIGNNLILYIAVIAYVEFKIHGLSSEIKRADQRNNARMDAFFRLHSNFEKDLDKKIDKKKVKAQ